MASTRPESTEAPNGVGADEQAPRPEPTLEEQTDALLADIERDVNALDGDEPASAEDQRAREAEAGQQPEPEPTPEAQTEPEPP